MLSSVRGNTFVAALLGSLALVLFAPTALDASTWAGLTPSVYGKWGPPVIIERGDSTLHQFTFTGTCGTSDNDVTWIPRVHLGSDLDNDAIFFSLDPTELVWQKEWEPQLVSGEETHTLSWIFAAYVSRPLVDPTTSPYRLNVTWSPLRVYETGGIVVQGEIQGTIFMQVSPEVVPEPGTMLLTGTGVATLLAFARSRRPMLSRRQP